MVELTLGSPTTGDVILTVDQSMYDDLGLEQVVPEPRDQQSDGERVRLTFDPPEGRILSVTFSGRIPTQQVPGAYRFRVEVHTPGSQVVETSFRTWVLPSCRPW